MPLASAPALLNLLEGLLMLIVLSTLFGPGLLRRYIAYCPDEEPSIFRMLDFISKGSLLLSWVLLGMETKRVGFGFPSVLFV